MNKNTSMSAAGKRAGLVHSHELTEEEKKALIQDFQDALNARVDFDEGRKMRDEYLMHAAVLDEANRLEAKRKESLSFLKGSPEYREAWDEMELLIQDGMSSYQVRAWVEENRPWIAEAMQIATERWDGYLANLEGLAEAKAFQAKNQHMFDKDELCLLAENKKAAAKKAAIEQANIDAKAQLAAEGKQVVTSMPSDNKK